LGIRRRVRDLPPPHHLRIKPQRVALPRERRRLGEGHEEILYGTGLAATNVEPPGQSVQYPLGRATDVARACENAGELSPVCLRSTPLRCAAESAEQSGERLRLPLRPIGSNAEHLLGARPPDGGLDGGDVADARDCGRGAPWLADAIAVDGVGGECVP